MSNKVYEIVTARILNELEKGEIPWRRPWNTDGIAKNLISRREYRGVNIWLLPSEKYSSCYWLTFNQCSALGGNIRRGEKGSMIVFYKDLEIEEEKDGATVEKTIPLLRYSYVFNLEQCENLPEKHLPKSEEKSEINPIEQAEKIIAEMQQRPEMTFGGNRAYYSPSRDLVNLPPKNSFKSAEGFYSVAFHELTHSTGHQSRLDRPEVMEIHNFGDEVYSREELTAELGAAFLCGITGIAQETLENSAAYIGSWLKVLSNDSKFVISASSKAQKAADFILGRSSK
ncbi:MAG: zincin-like metallopeptidase domain-containing protein [bacterium]|nr:zincin-like metallopeptidase domain-containing protein [bacterium]